MAMKPMPGSMGAYFNEELSLRVEVTSYEELDSIERVGLKVLKVNKTSEKYKYKKGDEFFYERKKDGSEEGLEIILTLD